MRIALLALLCIVSVAHAAPPTDRPLDPTMTEWYRSLHQPGTGASCCSVADCRPYDARIVKDHYEIRLHDKWWPVPDNVVLHRENPTGSAVACLRTQWNYELAPAPSDYTPEIMCFIPGFET